MALSIDQLINEVATSGLVPAAELLAWLAAMPEAERPKDGEELARELVQQQKLTRFQAEQIFAGQGKSLTLGNYLILDKLGQGGMGLVLKAMHRRMERVVALKVMSPSGMRSPDAVQRFHREVKAAAKLHHPNVVTAFDADEANGTHFLVMEYVEGTDLSALVKKHGPLPPGRAVEYILQAARGLEYAHSRGVVHRDIKPSNLLVCSSAFRQSDGTLPPEGGTTNVKILDMGLARIDEGADAQAELTTTGAVMGTVDYMAPEQALSAKSADARSDIYSLGITLWYLLTGRVAYEGDSVMAKLLAHRDVAIPSLADFWRAGERQPPDGVSTVPNPGADAPRLARGTSYKDLDSVFRNMVAKRPEDRYPSMTDVIRDLERWLSGAAPFAASQPSVPADIASMGKVSPVISKPILTADRSGLSASRTTVDSLALANPPSGAEAETMILSSTDGSADSGTEPSLTVNMGGFQHPKTKAVLWGTTGAAFIVILAIALSMKGLLHSSSDNQQIQSVHSQQVESAESSPDPSSSIVLEFDGRTSYVELPDVGLTLLKPLTVEAWVRLDKSATDANDLVLVNGSSVSLSRGGTGHWGFYGKQRSGGDHIIRSDGIAPLGVWVHVAAVSDGETRVLYVDGQRQKETASNSPDSVTTTFVLGALPIRGQSGGGKFLHGRLREVRLSKTVRYEADFQPQHRFMPDAATLALYHCDEGRGDILKDSSGNNHHGKIVGAKWVKVDEAPITVVRGNGLRFDGQGDSVLLPELTSRDQPLTVEAWLTLASEKDMSLVTIPLADGTGLFRLTVLNSGPQAVLVRNKSLAIAYSRSRTLPIGESFHLATVFLGNGRWSFWLNGELLSEGADHYGWSPPINRAFPAIVGMDDGLPLSAGQSRGAFHGTLRELRISQTERYKTNFRPAEHLEPDKDTLALYHCDEGSGDVLKDSSGNEHHGKIVGAQWAKVNDATGGVPAIGPVVRVPSSPWTDWLGPKLNKGDFGAQFDAREWVREGDAISTKGVISGTAVLPQGTRNGAIRLTYLLRDSKGIEIDARDGNTNGVRELYKAQDDGTQLSIIRFRKGSPYDYLAKQIVPASIPKELPRTLEFRVVGDTLTATLNGSVVATANDATNTVSNGTFALVALKGVLIQKVEYQKLDEMVPKTAAISDRANANGSPPSSTKAPFTTAQARAHQETWAKHLGTTVETTNSVGGKMVLIPPGEFLMGSTDEHVEAVLQEFSGQKLVSIESIKKAIRSERPQHRVAISQPFWMGATEVTVGQFRKFAETAGYRTEAERLPSDPAKPQLTWQNPGIHTTDDSPVGAITWNDATAFCGWLSQREGVTCRLPTEAEWEYACRAGTTTVFFNGDDLRRMDQVGWSNWNSGRNMHPVGLKLPNAFGLFDTHGNALEWCQDFFEEDSYAKAPLVDPTGPGSGSLRVLRGGAADGTPYFCRCAARKQERESYNYGMAGFRIVREVAKLKTQAAQASVITSPPTINTSHLKPPIAKAPLTSMQARTHRETWAKYLDTTIETTNSAGGKMVLIPPGEFLMGSSDEQLGAIIKEVEQLNLGREAIDRILKLERPQHRVVLTRPFFLGATEVTIGQFKKFVEATGLKTYAEKNATEAQRRTYLTPGYPVTDESPVSCVRWDEAVAYCRWLSDIEKTTYRLPTEAEWEYACRAGTGTLWSWGDDPKLAEKFAWTQSNSEGLAHPVASRQPNPFGVFDMHGNLSEWCQDSLDETWYARSPVTDPIAHSGTHINVRGGAFTHFAITRSAYRSGYGPGDFHPLRGFRVIREIDSPQEQPSADRRAAEWVIAQGGSVMVFGQEKWIVSTNDLPPSGLRLMHVKLGRSLSSPDTDLVPLRSLNNVVSVEMNSSNVSAAGIAGLESIPAVEQLGLSGVQLGDERVAALARLKTLKQLGLHGVELTPEQCATLARGLPQLVYLHLSSNRQLNDDAVDALRHLSNLTTLELNGTQVTASGVAALQKSLPNCKIRWDGAGQ